MRNWTEGAVLVAAAMMAFGCGDLESSKSVFHKQVVGPDGGNVIFETLKIEVPAGAVDEEVEISVAVTKTHPAGNLGPAYEVKSPVEFLKPVTLVFTVDKALVNEGAEFTELAPAWVGEDGKWIPLEGAVVSVGAGSAGTVGGSTTHLSIWGVVPNPAFPPPPCEEGCDDDNPCTVDSCDKDGNCTNTPKDCDDANPCTTDSCDKDGNCVSANKCDDGNPCSLDGCDENGECVHKFDDCNDADPCTSDTCIEGGGCDHTPIPDCCTNVGYFSDWKVPGDTCWDPPKNYCSEGASLMVTVACTQDLSLCCVYSDSCVPCGWTTDCDFCPEEGGDEWEYQYCGPPGGVCAGAPVPLPAFSSPECPPPHPGKDVPICLDEVQPEKKQMGEACDSADECKTELCLDTGANGSICTQNCVEECPPPFVCGPVEAGGGDMVFVCLPPCAPDCEGKECGDDGCGGSCGKCDAAELLVCKPETGKCAKFDTPDCTGKECGPDGFGGICGVCEEGCTCTAQGKCAGTCGTCTPACTGKTCGPDGCGGKCGDCGTEVCGADGLCHSFCEPACEPKGKCGPDGCGTWCGNCPENQGVACSDQGACEPCTPSCEGKACGPDGCRGWCDLCPVGQACSHATGQCAPACPCQGGSCSGEGFESGTLDGWSVDGDAQVVPNLGATPAPEGSFMALVGNGITAQHQGGTIERGFCVPENALWVKMTFSFYSEEFKEWCGSIYQDAVEVTLSDGEQTVTLLQFKLDDVCPASECNGCGTLFGDLVQSDVAFDQGDVWNTAWQKTAIPLPPGFAGKAATLKVDVTDKGDSIYISVLALDAIEFTTTP